MAKYPGARGRADLFSSLDVLPEVHNRVAHFDRCGRDGQGSVAVGPKSSRPQNTAVRASRASLPGWKYSASTPLGRTSTHGIPASHRMARCSLWETTQTRSMTLACARSYIPLIAAARRFCTIAEE